MAVGAGFETSENIRYAFPELVSMDYSLWPYIFQLDFAPDVFTHLRFIACLHRSVSSFLHVIWTGYFGGYTYVNVYVGKIGIFITVAVSLQLFADRVMSISEFNIVV
ncbi:hypothetical protein Pmar_PMAR024490 [Perkinsus marinus ATCC 50983]|uniref:Uncharacterized protein n=1 Tax=Perkinsus marinus (strain ATCC 50983 / TXsc) TaxID=423536 RepID=C5LT45_PERM5|nr:hypothetical protein Pmar_PMAR024490 [Perkinsus marinus ATCC 50983]EER00013.1 hypothetical protein Pmar_PMAR024490 [Perkinsus marinus ATCC 50983]|eukprot:XP_002767295.1 hypothetical protein Pmar_PMAR024490 [Perkinsus marinus ATCC 50983]